MQEIILALLGAILGAVTVIFFKGRDKPSPSNHQKVKEYRDELKEKPDDADSVVGRINATLERLRAKDDAE